MLCPRARPLLVMDYNSTYKDRAAYSALIGLCEVIMNEQPGSDMRIIV